VLAPRLYTPIRGARGGRAASLPGPLRGLLGAPAMSRPGRDFTPSAGRFFDSAPAAVRSAFVLSQEEIMKTLLNSVLTARRPLLAAWALGAVLAGSSQAQKVALVATLDSAQEVPPNASPARGTAYIEMDRAANTLTYALVYTGLSSAEVGAHIHGFSPAGANSGIRFNLPAGDFKSGVLVYPEADEASYLAELAYFNIHSANFAGGEIRGQIRRSASPYTYFALADGLQEVPPNPSAAKGVGWFRFDVLADTIDYSFTRTAVSTAEVAAHIHGFSPPGANSGIKINLPGGAHKSGVLPYLAGDEANYVAGLSYINIHSSNFPGGEIRGQIVPGVTNPTTFCTAKTNSQGCAPTAGWTGLPQLSGPDNLHITCSNVINNKAGVMYWGTSPRTTPAPFVGGFNCVQAPVFRTPVQNSGGNAPPDDCSGSYAFFFSHAYMLSRGLNAGDTVYCQYWYRDPAIPDGTSAGLSDAVGFEILP
jgi:hypothetical protein